MHSLLSCFSNELCENLKGISQDAVSEVRKVNEDWLNLIDEFK